MVVFILFEWLIAKNCLNLEILHIEVFQIKFGLLFKKRIKNKLEELLEEYKDMDTHEK